MKIEVYGHSDDCIEISSDQWPEEFYANEGGDYLAFSDGTVLFVEYTDNGVWRINREVIGTANYSKVEAKSADDDNYSDRVTLEGDIDWVVCGKFGRSPASRESGEKA